VIAHIEPEQDLHGYDNPWPAGGGKNKYSIQIGTDNTSRFKGGSATNDNGTLVVSVNTTLYSGCYINSSSKAYELASKMSGQCTVSYYAKADKTLNVFIGYAAHGNSSKPLTTSWQRFVDTATFDETGYTFNIYNDKTGDNPVAGTVYIKDFMFETGGTASDFTPYSNICPITGHTEVNVYVSPTTDSQDGTTCPITFPTEAGTVFGGYVDVTRGTLVVDRANIASYSGQTLPGEWISDRDVYTPGGTPTTGAQVVYKLAEPVVYNITPQQITTLLGTNNIWDDANGETKVEYRTS